MVDIAPFTAIRYRHEKVSALANVIAPPYDVIAPELQSELYAKDAHNIVRVDLNRAEPNDGELSRYERASAILGGWMRDGILAKDGSFAYYVLSQTFTGPDGVERTRTGFFGSALLTRFGEGPILPHERTLAGPKVDRLHLFRATRTNLSPIFGMYADPDGRLASVFASAAADAPIIEATMDRVHNRVWRIDDVDRIARIRGALESKKLYIADGHHRYETGLAYRDERRASATPGSAGDHQPAYERILMFSAAVEDPGMVVFPTHRLVHGLSKFDEPTIVKSLERFFVVTDAPHAPSEASLALRKAGANTNAYLASFRSGRRALLSRRADAPLAEVSMLPAHPSVRTLDVTILHAVILEHILGISRESQALQSNLRYSKDATEAFEAPARDASVEVAFLMNPTRVEEVIAVADAGEIMPQKSTFFYPKIPSGLVLFPLD